MMVSKKELVKHSYILGLENIFLLIGRFRNKRYYNKLYNETVDFFKKECERIEKAKIEIGNGFTIKFED